MLILMLEYKGFLSDFKYSTALVFVSNHFDPTAKYPFAYVQEQLGSFKYLSTNYLLKNFKYVAILSALYKMNLKAGIAVLGNI